MKKENKHSTNKEGKTISIVRRSFREPLARDIFYAHTTSNGNEPYPTISLFYMLPELLYAIKQQTPRLFICLNAARAKMFLLLGKLLCTGYFFNLQADHGKRMLNKKPLMNFSINIPYRHFQPKTLIKSNKGGNN